MKRNLLLTPGPTQVPPALCEALGRPIIHHRTPQFQENIKQAVEGLKEVFQTKNDIYILTYIHDNWPENNSSFVDCIKKVADIFYSWYFNYHDHGFYFW